MATDFTILTKQELLKVLETRFEIFNGKWLSRKQLIQKLEVLEQNENAHKAIERMCHDIAKKQK